MVPQKNPGCLLIRRKIAGARAGLQIVDHREVVDHREGNGVSLRLWQLHLVQVWQLHLGEVVLRKKKGCLLIRRKIAGARAGLQIVDHREVVDHREGNGVSLRLWQLHLVQAASSRRPGNSRLPFGGWIVQPGIRRKTTGRETVVRKRIVHNLIIARARVCLEKAKTPKARQMALKMLVWAHRAGRLWGWRTSIVNEDGEILPAPPQLLESRSRKRWYSLGFVSQRTQGQIDRAVALVESHEVVVPDEQDGGRRECPRTSRRNQFSPASPPKSPEFGRISGVSSTLAAVIGGLLMTPYSVKSQAPHAGRLDGGGVRQCGRPFGRSNEGSGVRSRRYRRRGGGEVRLSTRFPLSLLSSTC